MKKISIIITIFSISLVFLNSGVIHAQQDNELLIASWNLKDWGGGPGRSADVHDEVVFLMKNIMTGSNYPEVGINYDVIFVQEIKSKTIDGKKSYPAFDVLCDSLNPLGYVCATSRSYVAGEGYGVIYKEEEMKVELKDVTKKGIEPYIISGKYDSDQKMTRPPMKAIITLEENEFEFVVFNNHLKFCDENRNQQDAAMIELKKLNTHIKNYMKKHNDENIVILGDLNADCNCMIDKEDNDRYVSLSEIFTPDTWDIIIDDGMATNFFGNSCAYDRFILNQNMQKFYVGEFDRIGNLPPPYEKIEFGPDTLMVKDHPISDHRLIWAKFDTTPSSQTCFLFWCW